MNARLASIAKLYCVLALLVLALGPAVALADAHCVNPTATGGCVATIQAAINAADPGDTINVAPGTYGGNININKSLTIVGDPGDAGAGPGANAPIIDGGSLPGDGFKLTNGVTNVTIAGFEVRNFTSNGNGVGNAVQAWVASTSNITIRDNYFHDLGWNGVLVGNDGALGDHTNWMIKGNVLAKSTWYGFELTNASDSIVEDNIIHALDNFSVITVLARRNESGITIRNNQIDGSITGRAAIYIYAYSLEVANPQLTGVLIEGNKISTTGSLPMIRVRDLAGEAC